MPKVKTCPCIALLPPDATLPPPPPLIPSSTVLLKTVPSAPPSSFPPPSKKPCPPFIRGQVGHKFFSLSQPRSYTKIPDGCSLIITGFQKPLPHENVKTSFVLIDPFGGTWSLPMCSMSGAKRWNQVPSPLTSSPHIALLWFEMERSSS